MIPRLKRWLCGLWHLWVRVRFLALRLFTITRNSRGSNVLFWPMSAPVHSWKTHTQNISNNNNNNNNIISSIAILMHLDTLSISSAIETTVNLLRIFRSYSEMLTETTNKELYSLLLILTFFSTTRTDKQAVVVISAYFSQGSTECKLLDAHYFHFLGKKGDDIFYLTIQIVRRWTMIGRNMYLFLVWLTFQLSTLSLAS